MVENIKMQKGWWQIKEEMEVSHLFKLSEQREDIIFLYQLLFLGVTV